MLRLNKHVFRPIFFISIFLRQNTHEKNFEGKRRGGGGYEIVSPRKKSKKIKEKIFYVGEMKIKIMNC